MTKLIGYRSDIDGLRAVAVLAVVFYHTSPGRLPGGFVGVDVFFVISGFLISGVILAELARGHFSFAGFYGRRAKRLLPALIPVLVATLAFGACVLTPIEFAQLGKHTIGAATFSSNLLLWREAGYFDAAATLKPLRHLWSLGIEEQFYLVWPLALWVLWRRSRWLLAALATFTVCSFVLNIALVRIEPVATFYLPFTRFWELSIGGCLAWVASQAARDARQPLNSAGTLNDSARFGLVAREMLSTAGLLAILGATVAHGRESGFPGWWALVPTLGTAFVIAAGPGTWINRRVLGHPWMVFVGLISYPLYLWHWPLLSFSYIVGGEESRAVRFALAGFSFVLAVLTYQFLERRARNIGPYKLKKPSAALVPGLAASLAVVGGLGVAIYSDKGIPSRFSPPALIADLSWPALQIQNYVDAPLARQLFAGQFDGARDFFLMRSGPASQSLTVFLGDSHANRLFVAAGGADSLADRIANVGRGTCLPLVGVEAFIGGQSLKCQPLMDNTISWIRSSDRVKQVVLTAMYGQYLDGRVELRRSGQVTAGGTSTSLFVEALRETVSELTRSGKRVIVALDVPEVDFPVRECVSRSIFAAPRRPCAMSYAQHLKMSQAYRAAIDSVAKLVPSLIVVDPSAALCRGGSCDFAQGNDLLYLLDGNHLTPLGAQLVRPGLLHALYY